MSLVNYNQISSTYVFDSKIHKSFSILKAKDSHNLSEETLITHLNNVLKSSNPHIESPLTYILCFYSIISFNVPVSDENIDSIKKSIVSIVRRLKHDEDSLVSFCVSIISLGKISSKCSKIIRTQDGRFQVDGCKRFPHLITYQLWRESNITNKHDLSGMNNCSNSFFLKCPYVCINPYHYYVKGNNNYSKIGDVLRLDNEIPYKKNIQKELDQKLERMEKILKMEKNGEGSFFTTFSTHKQGLMNTVPKSYSMDYTMENGIYYNDINFKIQHDFNECISENNIFTTEDPNINHLESPCIQKLLNYPQNIFNNYSEPIGILSQKSQSLSNLNLCGINYNEDPSHIKLLNNMQNFSKKKLYSSSSSSYTVDSCYKQSKSNKMCLSINSQEIFNDINGNYSGFELNSQDVLNDPSLNPHLPQRESFDEKLSLSSMQGLNSQHTDVEQISPTKQYFLLRNQLNHKDKKSEETRILPTRKRHSDTINVFQLDSRQEQNIINPIEDSKIEKLETTEINVSCNFWQIINILKSQLNDPYGQISFHKLVEKITCLDNKEFVNLLPTLKVKNWGRVLYHEYGCNFGEPFVVSRPNEYFLIDGYSGEFKQSLPRISLGSLTRDLGPSEPSLKCLKNIGQGLKIRYKSNGKLLLKTYCEKSIFLYSPFILRDLLEDKALSNELGLGNGNDVLKLGKNAVISIFSLFEFNAIVREEFKKFLISFLNELKTVYDFQKFNSQTDNVYKSHLLKMLLNNMERKYFEMMQRLKNYCIIGVSFIKGWGTNYDRKRINETPCWIEIQITEAMMLVDNYDYEFNRIILTNKKSLEC